MNLVRFFDKLKQSLRKSNSSPPSDDTSAPAPPAPDADSPPVLDQPSTALATSSPAVVSEPADSPPLSEATPHPSSSPVATKQTANVRITRIRRIPRRVNRPRLVIRTREDADIEDVAKPAASIESQPVREDPEDSKTELLDEEPARETGQDEPEQPVPSSTHVITRKPAAQKRQRKIRVVKPKIRVVH
jgi:hypothetical protein